MAIFVQKSTGQLVAAADGFDDEGYVPATAEDIAAHNAPLERADANEQQSGGFLNEARTMGEDALRQVGSGTAAAARGLSTFGGDVDAMGNPTETVAPIDVQGKDLLPRVYADDALARREQNPTAAAIGGALPAVAAGLLLPGAGVAGVASTLGLDVASAAAQEATDAELAGEGVNGAHILRNAALNAVFSGAAGAIPAGARALVRGTEDLVTRTAKAATEKLERYGVKSVAKKAASVVDESFSAMDSIRPPKVANNPNSQRQALEDIADAFDRTEPMAKQVKSLANEGPMSRYRGLQELAEKAPADSDLAKSLQDTLQRADLWGQKAVDFNTDIAAARASRPAEDAGAEAWQAYADALRRLPGTTFAKHADLLDELAQTKALDGLRASPALDKMAGFAADAVGKKGTKLVAGAIGHHLAGPLGGFIGYTAAEGLGEAAGAALKPAALNGLVTGAKALKTLAENDRRLTARLMVNPEAAAKAVRVLGDSPSVYQRFKGDDETPIQAFQRHQQTLRSFAQDPSAMLSLMGETFGSLDEQSPQLYRQMVAQGTRISNYLQQEMPKPRGVSVARPNGSAPSPLEIRNWALKFDAATDPSSVMADARAGKLRPEQVATLKHLWPDEYNGLRQAVLEQLGRGSNTITRQRMNLLFGFDASVDPALGVRTRGLVAQARAAGAKAQLSTPKPNSNYAPKSPPSLAGMTPAGASALQLGPSLMSGRA